MDDSAAGVVSRRPPRRRGLRVGRRPDRRSRPRRRRHRRALPARHRGAGECRAPVRRAPDTGGEPANRARPGTAARACRSRAARAAALRRTGRTHALARLEKLAGVQRRARPPARGIVALSPLRPGDPGGGRRAGRRAGPPADACRAPARWAPGRAVRPQIRIDARLFRDRGAACARARRRRRVPALDHRRGGARVRGFGCRRDAGAGGERQRADARSTDRRATTARIRRCPMPAIDSRTAAVPWVRRYAHLVPAGARSSISPRGADVMHGSSLRALRRSSPSIAMLPRSRHWTVLRACARKSRTSRPSRGRSPAEASMPSSSRTTSSSVDRRSCSRRSRPTAR